MIPLSFRSMIAGFASGSNPSFRVEESAPWFVCVETIMVEL